MMLRSIFLPVGLLLAAASAADAGKGQDRLDRFLENTRTMTARFHQTLTAPDGVLLQQSGGDVFFERPDRFRWNYTQPFEQQIVADGEHIWIYDVELQQVTVSEQDRPGVKTPMALLESRESMREAFDIHDRGEVEGIARIELISKSTDVDFSRVLIGFDAEHLRFLQFLDQFEQTTLIRFSDIEVNEALDADLFVFNPPEGVDVFSGR